MKINLDQTQSAFAINAYGNGWANIGEHRVDRPCLVGPGTLDTDVLPSSPDALTARDFDAMLKLMPEVLLLGTGATQQFIDYKYTVYLAEQGVALETMDTGAACRLFNVLLNEERAVVAALFF